MILYEPVVFSESKTFIKESFKIIESFDPVLLSELKKTYGATSATWFLNKWLQQVVLLNQNRTISWDVPNDSTETVFLFLV